jgi:hypothetical protein
MDRGPFPRRRERLGTVEDLGRSDHADDAVVQEDVADRHEEDEPVLVERQQDDEDEEVEVGLQQAAGHVGEQRRRRHEAEHDGERAHLRGQPPHRREHGERTDRDPVLERVGGTEAPELDAEDDHGNDVDPQERREAAVAAAPFLLRQLAARRQERAQARQPRRETSADGSLVMHLTALDTPAAALHRASMQLDV